VTDWQLTFNGLVCGPGTSYLVTSVDGWLDVQGVTTVDTPRPNADGTWTTPDYNPSRLVNVTIDIAGDVTPFATAVAAFEAATQTQAAPSAVVLTIPGRSPETIMAKVRRRVIPTDFAFARGLTQASVQFFAPDPRRLGAVVTASTGLPTSTGGLTFPATWPVAWRAITLSGSISIVNPGDTAGPLALRIDGPCTAPVITQVGTGRVLAFSSSLVMPADDWLVIDMGARTVLDRGTSSRAGYLTSRGFFDFLPGTNVIAWTASTYDSRARLTATGYPAWR